MRCARDIFLSLVRAVVVLPCLLASVLFYPCYGNGGETREVEIRGSDWLREEWILKYIEPLPDQMPGATRVPAARIALGEMLFSDPLLSVDGTVSCASCHRLEPGLAGTDRLPKSNGVRGATGLRNAPTVLNAGFQFAQFWDGRAPTLEDQVSHPLLAAHEMGNPDESSLERRLQNHPNYPEKFQTAFPESDSTVSIQKIAEAIAAFERTLISKGRFDRWLAGDNNALNQKETNGLELFFDRGCHSCHSTSTFGGQMFMRLGTVKPYKNLADEGRKALSGNPEEQFVFKVPSLRNVALTAPYFHDGSIPTLEEALMQMAELQIGIPFTQNEIEEIVAFLHTLSDDDYASQLPDIPSSPGSVSSDSLKPKLQ